MICRAEMAPSRAAPRWESRLVRVNKVIVDVHAIARGDKVDVGRVAVERERIGALSLVEPLLWPLDHREQTKPQASSVRREREGVHLTP